MAIVSFSMSHYNIKKGSDHNFMVMFDIVFVDKGESIVTGSCLPVTMMRWSCNSILSYIVGVNLTDKCRSNNNSSNCSPSLSDRGVEGC